MEENTEPTEKPESEEAASEENSDTPSKPKGRKKKTKKSAEPSTSGGYCFGKRCRHNGETFEAGSECTLTGPALKHLLANGVVRKR